MPNLRNVYVIIILVSVEVTRMHLYSECLIDKHSSLIVHYVADTDGLMMEPNAIQCKKYIITVERSLAS